jgi:hypothetical protein
MKSLAELIMRGRLQAMTVAAGCIATLLLAWVGVAAVGLVVLRHGVNAATGVILAALIPGAGWALYGHEPGPLTAVLVIVVLAAILRQTRSWSMVLMVLPLLVSAFSLGLLYLAPEFIAQILEQLQVVMQGLAQQMQRAGSTDVSGALATDIRPEQLLGVFGLSQAMNAVISLLLARWWQSLLYNPGGFREEFHRLRLDKVAVIVIVGGLVWLNQADGYAIWSWMYAVPLCVAGLALAHGLAGIYQLSRQWLILFYLLLAVFALPLLPLLMMAAIADSALDFRGRAARAG